MTERKSVYMEEYLAVLHNALKEHPDYRSDMRITLANAHGDLAFNSHDKVTSPEDVKVLEEVLNLVQQTHKLIVP